MKWVHPAQKEQWELLVKVESVVLPVQQVRTVPLDLKVPMDQLEKKDLLAQQD